MCWDITIDNNKILLGSMLLQVLLDVATHVLWKDGSATFFARHTPPSDVRMQICCRSKSLAASFEFH